LKLTQTIPRSKAFDPKDQVQKPSWGNSVEKASPNAVDQQFFFLLGMTHQRCIAPHPNFDTNRYGFKMIGLPKKLSMLKH